MMSLVVEGWRGISHSYAMVNQYQLLELMKYDVNLFHIDRPYYKSDWNPQKDSDGFGAESRRRLAAIPAPPAGFVPDVTLRMDFPFRFAPSEASKLFVFGTSEVGNINGKVADGDLEKGLGNPDLTIITPSQWSKAGFVNAGFDPARIVVIPHGVDGSIFKPLDPATRTRARAALGLADGEFAIVSVGAMTENKGIDLLIAAYAMLKLQYPRLRLILKDASNLYGIRGASVFEPLAAFRPDLMTDALRASIIFISQNMTLDQLATLYGAADCYASPYRAEGFNLPPLEAAACGLPIVVTDGGSTDDYRHDSFALPIAARKLSSGPVTLLEPDLNSLMSQLSLLIEAKAPAINQDVAVRHINATYSWTAIAKQLMAAFTA